jgi:hypothetical protein
MVRDHLGTIRGTATPPQGGTTPPQGGGADSPLALVDEPVKKSRWSTIRGAVKAMGAAKHWTKTVDRAKVERAKNPLSPDALTLRALKAQTNELRFREDQVLQRVKFIEDVVHACHPHKSADWKPQRRKGMPDADDSAQRASFAENHENHWSMNYYGDSPSVQYIDKNRLQFVEKILAEQERKTEHKKEAYPFLTSLAGVDGLSEKQRFDRDVQREFEKMLTMSNSRM